MSQESTTVRAPNGLGYHGKKLWRQVNAIWHLEPPALVILESACRTLDQIKDLEKLLDEEGQVVFDRFQQRKTHPAAVLLRQNRSALSRLLRDLSLDEDEYALPMRPRVS